MTEKVSAFHRLPLGDCSSGFISSGGSALAWPVDQKLIIFKTCFIGLTHVYGTYEPRTGRSRQVKSPVTDRVILRHLSGEQPYGVYLLVKDRTRAVVADFDEEDPEPGLAFIKQASQYGISAYLERSKRKGWHAWVFLDRVGVPAAKGRTVVRAILEDIGRPATEVFPKQDALLSPDRVGNFINAPLFGRLVPQGRTVFVNPNAHLRPFPDQWAALRGVQRVSERQLDEIIEINDLAVPGSIPTRVQDPAADDQSLVSYGLAPCARRMLAEGVDENQRVACFRLAIGLKKAGVPLDIAIAGLKAWAAKNQPRAGKGIITPGEIVEQATYAYTKPYRGCGCEESAIQPFCHPQCPLRISRSKHKLVGGGLDIHGRGRDSLS